MALALPFGKKKAAKKEDKKEDKKEEEKPVSQMNTDEKLVHYGFGGRDPKTGEPKPKREEAEIYQHNWNKTDWPSPTRRFRLVLESPELNIEQTYYWFVRHFQEQWGCDKTEKITDNLASSVSSSFFGNMQTRISAQQNQASQYLKGISDMIKGLFQIVREIRVIDDRLSYYYDSDKPDSDLAISSEIVLKGLWVDQVEGGSKNPSSVYGLAQTVGFTILPDVFFRIRVKGKHDIERAVTALKFNEKIKEILKRKLRQYYEWKERTLRELEQRKNFEVKYLRQHYDTIKLYMSWIMPYLRNIRRMQMNEKNMGNINIINAFESQIIEIETLFYRSGFGEGYNGVVSLHIFYRARPELAYHSYEYQHKGPIYSGQADITLRAYPWTDGKIGSYRKYREEGDIELMGSIDGSIQAALDSLGDELKKYLTEAGEKFPSKTEEKKEKPRPLPGVAEPFVGVFQGFAEIFGSLFPREPKQKEDKDKEKKKEKVDPYKEHNAEHAAAEFAEKAIQTGYQKFKEGPADAVFFIPV